MERDEGRGVGNGLDRGLVLAMVLIENVLILLLMIEQLECKPAISIAKQQSHTVLGVAMERRPAITITK